MFIKYKSIIFLNYFFKSPSENIEYDQSSVEFSGNYQSHFIGITPRRPSGTWEEMIIQPGQEMKEFTNNQSKIQIYTKSLQIPVKIKKSILYRIKSYYWWIVIFASLFFINSVLDQLPYFETNNYTIMISLILSALIGIFVLLIPKRTWE